MSSAKRTRRILFVLVFLGVCEWYDRPWGFFWGFLGLGFVLFVFYTICDAGRAVVNSFTRPNITYNEYKTLNVEEGAIHGQKVDPTRPDDEPLSGLVVTQKERRKLRG